MKQDEKWGLTIEYEPGKWKAIRGTGPVELVQAACVKAGVVLARPKKNQWLMQTDGTWTVCYYPEVFNGVRPVIPDEPEPCKNCQNVKSGEYISRYWNQDDGRVCLRCGKPESEWTYAEPDWAGIGSGIM